MGEPRSDTALSMLPVDSLPALLLLVTLWFDGILKQKFIDSFSTVIKLFQEKIHT